MSPIKALATLTTIAIGLATLEWWAVNELNGSDKFAGPIMGVAFVAALAVLTRLLNRFTGQWHNAVIAALTALVELIFCVAVFGSLSAVAVILLPFSVTSRFMQGDSATDFIIFFMLTLGLVIAARGWAKYSAQALLASKAKLESERARAQVAERDRELARSELTILRAQIEPHFLWNTLAHVQYLTRKCPEDAERMTGHLIRFLRTAVPKNRGDMTTLGSEMEAVDAYLELMKIRMGARLTSTVEMDQKLADTPFPPLLIQTLVENAIKHGIEPKVGPATISVNATLLPDGLRMSIVVRDSGIGLQQTPETKGSGLGLNSVRERLKLLYGSAATLTVNGAAEGGVISEIQAPLKLETPL
jgi:sensor histidine kinase YesM